LGILRASGNGLRDYLMPKAATHFDAETIAVMKTALDEAWARLPPKMQAKMLKTTLAERILKFAAEGERNRERLRDAALRDLAA
jgi:hypothetical protein